MIRTPRRARHDVRDRDRELARLLGDDIEHQACGFVAGIVFGAHEPELQAPELGRRDRERALGLDDLHARRGRRRIEERELRACIGDRDATAGGEREITQRAGK